MRSSMILALAVASSAAALPMAPSVVESRALTSADFANFDLGDFLKSAFKREEPLLDARQSALPITEADVKAFFSSIFRRDVDERALTSTDLANFDLGDFLKSAFKRDLETRQSALPITEADLKAFFGSIFRRDVDERALTSADFANFNLLDFLKSAFKRDLSELETRQSALPITEEDVKAFFSSIFKRDIEARQSAAPITEDDIKAFFSSIFRREEIEARQSALPITEADVKAFFSGLFKREFDERALTSADFANFDLGDFLKSAFKRDLETRQSALPITEADVKAFFSGLFKREGLDARQSALPITEADVKAFFSSIFRRESSIADLD